MQRIVIVLLLLCVPTVTQNETADAPKPLRTVTLTPEQNRLLADVQAQMTKLELQFKQLQARQQGILDTIAATNNLPASTLNEIKPGEFELKEAPPKIDDKPKPKEKHK